MLKVAEQEELEAYRFLVREVRSHSQQGTAVAKLVGLLATSFSADLMVWVTDFERRVTSWEHEANETLSDLINVGFVIKGLEKEGCVTICRPALLAPQNGTHLCENLKRSSWHERTQTRHRWTCRQSVKIRSSKETVRGAECVDTWKDTAERELSTKNQDSQSSGWPGTAKAGLALAKAKVSLTRAKEKAKAKAKAETMAKMERKAFVRWCGVTPWNS